MPTSTASTRLQRPAAAGGCVRTSIPRYDGERDMAMIEVPDDAAAQLLEKLAGADGNVLTFKVR